MKKILFIGDSIMYGFKRVPGYGHFVRESLAGTAEVILPSVTTSSFTSSGSFFIIIIRTNTEHMNAPVQSMSFSETILASMVLEERYTKNEINTAVRTKAFFLKDVIAQFFCKPVIQNICRHRAELYTGTRFIILCRPDGRG